MTDLLLSSGSSLARRIRDGELTSRAVVDEHIAAIERVNPALNAVVAFRYEEARAEADAADAALQEARAGGTIDTHARTGTGAIHHLAIQVLVHGARVPGRNHHVNNVLLELVGQMQIQDLLPPLHNGGLRHFRRRGKGVPFAGFRFVAIQYEYSTLVLRGWIPHLHV